MYHVTERNDWLLPITVTQKSQENSLSETSIYHLEENNCLATLQEEVQDKPAWSSIGIYLKREGKDWRDGTAVNSQHFLLF